MGGLKDADSTTTIIDIEGILLRWKSHFKNLLNDHVDTPDDLLRMTPQLPIGHWMSLPPSIQEFNKDITCMNPGKAPGPDYILLEFFTHSGPELRNCLILLILKRPFQVTSVMQTSSLSSRRGTGRTATTTEGYHYLALPVKSLLAFSLISFL